MGNHPGFEGSKLVLAHAMLAEVSNRISVHWRRSCGSKIPDCREMSIFTKSTIFIRRSSDVVFVDESKNSIFSLSI